MKLGSRTSGEASARLARPGALPLHMRNTVVEIRDLYTPPQHRGQGHATALLREVMVDADKTRSLLLLMVEDCPTHDALVAFYERREFVTIQRQPTIMVRPHAGMVNG